MLVRQLIAIPSQLQLLVQLQSYLYSLANRDSWIKNYQLVHQDLQLNNE